MDTICPRAYIMHAVTTHNYLLYYRRRESSILLKRNNEKIRCMKKGNGRQENKLVFKQLVAACMKNIPFDRIREKPASIYTTARHTFHH